MELIMVIIELRLKQHLGIYANIWDSYIKWVREQRESGQDIIIPSLFNRWFKQHGTMVDHPMAGKIIQFSSIPEYYHFLSKWDTQ
jgi:hypothetical protein